MTGWRRVQGLSSERDLWVVPEGDSRPEMGYWTTEDGRDVMEVVGAGQADTLAFPVWFEQSPDGGDRRGDMVWTQGAPMTIVSEAFVEGLRTLGVEGWDTYPVDIRGRDGEAIPGYVGFVPDATGTSEVVVGSWPNTKPFWSLTVTENVCLSLKEMGLLFDHEPETDRRAVKGLRATT